MDGEQAEDNDDGAADQFHMASHAGGIWLVIVVLYVSGSCNERKIKR